MAFICEYKSAIDFHASLSLSPIWNLFRGVAHDMFISHYRHVRHSPIQHKFLCDDGVRLVYFSYWRFPWDEICPLALRQTPAAAMVQSWPEQWYFWLKSAWMHFWGTGLGRGLEYGACQCCLSHLPPGTHPLNLCPFCHMCVFLDSPEKFGLQSLLINSYEPTSFWASYL